MRELEARRQPEVFSPEEMGAQSKDPVDTRWVLTWKEVGGVKTVKARLTAKKTGTRICVWAMWMLLVA